MTPPIQYVRSKDGTNIAYWTYGEGPPLLLTGILPTAHAQLEWEIPLYRRWYERLAEGRTLISHNARGSGLSDRDPADMSLAAHVTDLEAVADRLHLDIFDLFGVFHSGPAAISLAATHPGRVSRLVLWGGYLKGSDYAEAPRIQATRAMVAEDWDAYVETLAFFAFGWADTDSARHMADLIREAITQEGMQRVIAEIQTVDICELAQRVVCPTLVMQARKAAWPSLDTARRVAAAIPGARMNIVEGDRVMPFGNDIDSIVAIIQAFLAEPAADQTEPAGGTGSEDGLTTREAEVLRLLANGQSNKEIASELSLSVHTVERHLANIYAKIGARGRTDAAAYALKNRLL